MGRGESGGRRWVCGAGVKLGGQCAQSTYVGTLRLSSAGVHGLVRTTYGGPLGVCQLATGCEQDTWQVG